MRKSGNAKQLAQALRAIAALKKRHVANIASHQKKHAGRLVQILHKIHNHKKYYKNGRAPKRSSGKRMPTKAAGMTLQGSGFFDWVRGLFNKGKKLAKKAGTHVLNEAKKTGREIKADLKKELKSAARKGLTGALSKTSDVITGKSTVGDAVTSSIQSGKAYVKERVAHHKAKYHKKATDKVAHYKQEALNHIEKAKKRLAED